MPKSRVSLTSIVGISTLGTASHSRALSLLLGKEMSQPSWSNLEHGIHTCKSCFCLPDSDWLRSFPLLFFNLKNT